MIEFICKVERGTGQNWLLSQSLENFVSKLYICNNSTNTHRKNNSWQKIRNMIELESDFKEFKKHKNNIFNFKGNEEMKELFDSISNNLERDIKNLKENGIK